MNEKLDPIRVTVEEAAALQSYPVVWDNRPATTIAANPVVAGPGTSEFVKGGVSRQDRPGSIKVEPEQAGQLQSYENFTWDATMPNGKPVPKTKKYLVVGNACPPLLVERVLEELWGRP